MGFWGWLTGKRDRMPVRDNLWLTSSARYQGVCRAIKEADSEAALVLVLAHFPASLKAVKQALTEAGITHDGVGRTLSVNELERRRQPEAGPQILVGLVRQLQPDPFPNPNPDEQGRLECLVVERHFVRAHDDDVSAFAASLGRPCAITFHLSLEDPLLRPIGGDWMRGLLQRLGAQESAPITSEMISRRIPRAQDRYSQQADEEHEADSAEQWLELNAPSS
jgi:preprotein translocase subunit SecA